MVYTLKAIKGGVGWPLDPLRSHDIALSPFRQYFMIHNATSAEFVVFSYVVVVVVVDVLKYITP